MTKYCKGCAHHHNAGHPKPNKHNDWCCKYGSFAGKIWGHCKLNGGRILK